MLGCDQLLKEYPHLFSENAIIKCGYGWQRILEDFCTAVDLVVSNGPYEEFILYSLKEKFGILTIDYSGGDDLIKEIVDFTESLSYTMCELCGVNGKLYADSKWRLWSSYKTLCNDHAIQLYYYEIKLKKGNK